MIKEHRKNCDVWPFDHFHVVWNSIPYLWWHKREGASSQGHAPPNSPSPGDLHLFRALFACPNIAPKFVAWEVLRLLLKLFSGAGPLWPQGCTGVVWVSCAFSKGNGFEGRETAAKEKGGGELGCQASAASRPNQHLQPTLLVFLKDRPRWGKDGDKNEKARSSSLGENSYVTAVGSIRIKGQPHKYLSA